MKTRWAAWLGILGAGTMIMCAATNVSAQQKTVAYTAPTVPAASPVAVAVKRAPRGPIEKYDCKIGTEDQHARIAVLAQGGEVQSVAYYGKWKPRTCSVHLQRGDAFSKWNKVGEATTITTEHGDFLIQASQSEYQLFFREVDRMHYCGMMGKLNGSMTVTRGSKLECSVVGIMDRNETEALPDKEAERLVATTVGDANRADHPAARNGTAD